MTLAFSPPAYLIEIDLNGNELAVTAEQKKQERKGLLRRKTRRAGEFN